MSRINDRLLLQALQKSEEKWVTADETRITMGGILADGTTVDRGSAIDLLEKGVQYGHVQSDARDQPIRYSITPSGVRWLENHSS